jgi:hypothetical protein
MSRNEIRDRYKLGKSGYEVVKRMIDAKEHRASHKDALIYASRASMPTATPIAASIREKIKESTVCLGA